LRKVGKLTVRADAAHSTTMRPRESKQRT